MITSPFERRQLLRDSGSHGRVAEKKAARRFRAKQTPASGALAGAKGDFAVGDFLIENKATISRSFTLKTEVLFKIYQEALEVGKTPALSLQFTNGIGESEKRERWVVIREDTFMELISRGL